MTKANSVHDARSTQEYVPSYDRRQWLAEAYDAEKHNRFATQILQTVAPFCRRPTEELLVLDIGSGNGYTTVALAEHCRQVVGIELSEQRVRRSEELRDSRGLTNVLFRCQNVLDVEESDAYDLIVLDNVLEHLPDQPRAFRKVAAALRPGGAIFILTPNRLWPIEVHYRLPFLSYLPLSLANRYLRMTGRGTDYTDASYCLTYFGLRKMLKRHLGLPFQFVLPANVTLAAGGGAWHYRFGVRAIRVCPWLWAISKAFLVIAVKDREVSS